MPRYNLDQLGWLEFEHLIQTLLKLHVGLGVEAWGGRGDFGRDAYYHESLNYPTAEKVSGPFLFQCKFVENANSAGARSDRLLLAAVRKECKQIAESLTVNRRWEKEPAVYTLFTNAPLNPKTRQQVTTLVKNKLPRCEIILSDGNDICAWIDAKRDVVKSFPQLFSIRDLQSFISDCVNAGTIERSAIAIKLAEEKARVFVPTSAYDEARRRLQKHSFVILTGPPEMGKTTIGRLIALSQMSAGWEVIECKTAKEMLDAVAIHSKQVFVADDFFGRTDYEPHRVSEWQSELPYVLSRLDQSHWLILTSRAHLLEMGKARLDIADQNHRFPSLGEVVVNAGQLHVSEKARMLYRHAKAVQLSAAEKSIIKQNARWIVQHSHFTPERIRRLISEYLPTFFDQGTSDTDKIRNKIEEAVTNPTKQMQVSFRALPASHRWLLFSLLDRGEPRRVWLNSNDTNLEDYYNKLCPSNYYKSFNMLLQELTEAFVHEIPVAGSKEIDWIHPSCRDLAVEELALDTSDKMHFLRQCSMAGILLAASVGGGYFGKRQLPLLETDEDWRVFSDRVLSIYQKEPSIFLTLTAYYDVLLRSPDQRIVRRKAKQLLNFLHAQLALDVKFRLETGDYALNRQFLDAYIHICQSADADPIIDLTSMWASCVADSKEWLESENSIWTDESVPENAVAFIKAAQQIDARYFEENERRQELQSVLRNFHARAEGETHTYYLHDKSEDADDKRNRSDGYEKLAAVFREFDSISQSIDFSEPDFDDVASHFARESEDAVEDLSREVQSKPSEIRASSTEFLDVDALFGDL